MKPIPTFEELTPENSIFIENSEGIEYRTIRPVQFILGDSACVAYAVNAKGQYARFNWDLDHPEFRHLTLEELQNK